MHVRVVKRLLDLNREFYSRFGRSFSESRSADRISLEAFRSYISDGTRLLDIGCGNGRLAEKLDQVGYRLEYLGLDSSAELLAAARLRLPHLHGVRAEFRQADLAEPGWANTTASGRSPFDVAVMLAVLHHLPGSELRAQVLTDLCPLLRPGGVLVMSNWQLQNSPRLMRKVVPWPNEWAPEDLEPGDVLIDWQRDGRGLRYVHLIDEDQMQALADHSGYRVLAQYNANDDLDLISVLQRG